MMLARSRALTPLPASLACLLLALCPSMASTAQVTDDIDAVERQHSQPVAQPTPQILDDPEDGPPTAAADVASEELTGISDAEAAAEDLDAVADGVVVSDAATDDGAAERLSTVDVKAQPAPLVRPSLTKKENLYTGETDPVADWAKTILTRRSDRIETQAVTRKFYDSLYAGFGISQATISPEVTNEFELSNDFSNARRFFIGYAIREWMALEVYYTDLGHVEVAQKTRDETVNRWALGYEEYGVLLNVTTPYPGFLLRPFRRWSGVDLERHFKPYFHMGYGDLNFDWAGNPGAVVDESPNQFLLGAGLVANFASQWVRWQLRFGFTQYGTDVGAFSVDWLLFTPGTGY